MSSRATSRSTKVILTGLVLTALLATAACGRRGPPVPPEGEEANYTYPQFYPNPEETLRLGRDDPRLEEEVESEERASEEQDYNRILKQPKAGYRFHGDGYSRSQSLTY